MKKKLIIITIIFCLVQYFDSAIGYGSTATEEVKARRGFVNEAALTQAEEERKRVGRVNDARFTQKEEERDLISNHDYYASATEAAERAARN